jgi:hypothetical protein
MNFWTALAFIDICFIPAFGQLSNIVIFVIVLLHFERSMGRGDESV